MCSSLTLHGLLRVHTGFPEASISSRFSSSQSLPAVRCRKTLHLELPRWLPRHATGKRLSSDVSAREDRAYVMFRNKTEKREIIMLRLRRRKLCRDQLAFESYNIDFLTLNALRRLHRHSSRRRSRKTESKSLCWIQVGWLVLLS